MPLPTTMKAAVIDRFGPAGEIQVRTVPVPELEPHEVLIAVHTAGVGMWDARIRDGSWAEGDERFPLILGTDGAGTIAAIGSRVRRFGTGNEVWASSYSNPKGGFYAEYVAVPEDQVGRVPERLDLAHAGAAAATGLTALQGVDDVLEVGNDETVLIFGASGAVGTLAVQFAKRVGARVIATATAKDADKLVRKLGADATVDPRDGDAPAKLAVAAPDGVDAVLALAGGESLERLLDLVRGGGRVAFPNGVEPAPRTRATFTVRSYDGLAGNKEFERLSKAVNESRLSVPVAAAYPLEQASRAHARLEEGHVLGRLVLRARE